MYNKDITDQRSLDESHFSYDSCCFLLFLADTGLARLVFISAEIPPNVISLIRCDSLRGILPG